MHAHLATSRAGPLSRDRSRRSIATMIVSSHARSRRSVLSLTTSRAGPLSRPFRTSYVRWYILRFLRYIRLNGRWGGLQSERWGGLQFSLQYKTPKAHPKHHQARVKHHHEPPPKKDSRYHQQHQTAHHKPAIRTPKWTKAKVE